MYTNHGLSKNHKICEICDFRTDDDDVMIKHKFWHRTERPKLAPKQKKIPNGGKIHPKVCQKILKDKPHITSGIKKVSGIRTSF